MSLLTSIQDAMVICGLESPSSAYASGDPTVAQFVALAQVEGDELSRFHDWRKLKVAGTITGDGTTTLWDLPTDFDRFLSGMTFWSEESPGDMIPGPIRDDDLLAMKAMQSDPPEPVWRLFGDDIEIWPALDNGEIVRYEYRTANWILDNNGTTTKARWAADTDTALVPERILTLGVVWRWKQTKGLEYSEAFRSYQFERTKAAARDGGMGIIKLAESGKADIARMGRPAIYTVTP